CPWSLNITSFCHDTAPALRAWGGIPLNITSITDIHESEDGIITFFAEQDTSGIGVIPEIGAGTLTSGTFTSCNGQLINNGRHAVAVYNTGGLNLATLNPGESIDLPAALYIISSPESTVKFLHK
ncbi:MAG: hypothetical protein K2J15_06140, partial [Muribaculaceae bacterium]|nr:hypothetical protein [Muribaculaceae bacterium]